MTSRPESRLSRGTEGFEFVGHDNAGVRRQPEFGQIFVFEVKRYGFAKISRYFVKGSALRDDRNLDALRDVTGILAGANNGLYSVLEFHNPHDSTGRGDNEGENALPGRQLPVKPKAPSTSAHVTMKPHK